MKRQIALAVGITALTVTTASFAQDAVYTAPAPATAVVEPAPAPAVVEHSSGYEGPNRYMIGSGLVVFGLSYIPAVAVAAESSTSADHHLYVPIVGPWLDMGTRPACGPQAISCDNETTNKVLLGVDGVFQGLGALTTIFGFLSPEHDHTITTTAAADKPTLHFTPAQVGPSAYGATAFGTF
ncbi:MAG TPA: hypothetical protein VGG39_04745 [Polyangiaceae bacterium]|jgi:hypothetical protein